MDQTAPCDGHLRRVAGLDGEPVAPTLDTPVDYAELLATCARESTGANRVVAALARAALDWLIVADVKRLRSSLLGIVADLDHPPLET